MTRWVAATVVFLAVSMGCRWRSKVDDVVLSYSESNTFCFGCPKFRVDFRDGGHVYYECVAECAVPGERHYRVPEERFRELVQAFHNSGFFAIPRTDPRRAVTDVTVIRLTYRDERRIHETVDGMREVPRLTSLEKRVKAATEVDRYLNPSVGLYRDLVNSGWDVNTLGPDHRNALFSAAVFGDLESTRFLLQHGSTGTDETLEMAAMSENLELLRLVFQASQSALSGEVGARVLGQAARSHKTDLVEFLLDSGADANSHDPSGTPLMSAVTNGSLENAGLLLDRGADANARDSNGRTALWHAAISEKAGSISLLVAHGADVNATDSEGRTALMHAADLCYTWDIRALLDAGADATVRDKRGKSALEPQLVSVGDPKCRAAREMIEAAVRARAGHR
jgi:ankyrin repeat protein